MLIRRRTNCKANFSKWILAAILFFSMIAGQPAPASGLSQHASGSRIEQINVSKWESNKRALSYKQALAHLRSEQVPCDNCKAEYTFRILRHDMLLSTRMKYLSRRFPAPKSDIFFQLKSRRQSPDEFIQNPTRG